LKWFIAYKLGFAFFTVLSTCSFQFVPRISIEVVVFILILLISMSVTSFAFLWKIHISVLASFIFMPDLIHYLVIFSVLAFTLSNTTFRLPFSSPM
jgi:hypothetical protein